MKIDKAREQSLQAGIIVPAHYLFVKSVISPAESAGF
jgi:hypothetical protein